MTIADNLAQIAALKNQIHALELANVLEETGIKINDVYTQSTGKDKQRFTVQSFDTDGQRVKVMGKLSSTKAFDAYDLVNGWAKVV